MHINEFIIDSTKLILRNRYSIYIPEEDWNLFKSPITNNYGEIDELKFFARQEKSIQIITRILDYHGKSKIVNFLGNLAKIELNIQTLQPRVRDHVVHAINTFVLGVFLLKNLKLPKMIYKKFNYPFLWKFCGPTHDIGYPIEIAHNVKKPFIEEFNRILDEIGSPSPKIHEKSYPEDLNILSKGDDSNNLIQNKINEWELDIDIDDYYKWLNACNVVDHGVISALAQLKIIDALYQKRNPDRVSEDIIVDNLNYNQNIFNYDIVSASSAVFIHNIDLTYPGFNRKINFNIAPLAFLLFLCDTFQEWDRYTENRPIYSGNNFNIKCNKNSIKLYVPLALESKIINTLNHRLCGLKIFVNDYIAVE